MLVLVVVATSTVVVKVVIETDVLVDVNVVEVVSATTWVEVVRRVEDVKPVSVIVLLDVSNSELVTVVTGTITLVTVLVLVGLGGERITETMAVPITAKVITSTTASTVPNPRLPGNIRKLRRVPNQEHLFGMSQVLWRATVLSFKQIDNPYML